MLQQQRVNTVHWISGLIISLFFLLHVSNHLAAFWGIECHMSYMKAVRKIYRNPIIETVLLGAILVQASTGIVLAVKFRNVKKKGFEKLRIYSGLYIAFFLIVHTAAILIYRSKGVDTNFYFAVLGFILFPASIVFIPYYALSVLAVFFHIASTHYFKIQRFVSQRQARKHAYLIIFLGLLITGLIVYSFISAMEGRQIPAEYMKLAQ